MKKDNYVLEFHHKVYVTDRAKDPDYFAGVERAYDSLKGKFEEVSRESLFDVLEFFTSILHEAERRMPGIGAAKMTRIYQDVLSCILEEVYAERVTTGEIEPGVISPGELTEETIAKDFAEMLARALTEKLITPTELAEELANPDAWPPPDTLLGDLDA